MAGRGGGIPGIALSMATAGGFLLYIGIRNVPLLDGLKAMLKGKVPTPRPKKPVAVPAVFKQGGEARPLVPVGPKGTAFGARIVQAALRYRGEPYFWGGHQPRSEGGPGFDCSGYVTWVLHHDLGLDLPDNVHTVTGQFLVWNGGSDIIPRADCGGGDLVCWPGHIGIAVDNKTMLNAPTFGKTVEIGNIWPFPEPIIRRVRAQ